MAFVVDAVLRVSLELPPRAVTFLPAQVRGNDNDNSHRSS
jgi:hypothetical protein